MSTEELYATSRMSELQKELAQKTYALEIEAALENVRAVALGMKQPADMLEVCRTISQQLTSLGVKEIRNVQTAIFYQDKGTYMNYEYYAKHDKAIITETGYNNNEIHRAFADKMLKGYGEFFVSHIKGSEVKDWIAYQKTTNVFIDDYLNTASSLNYYWYSLGAVALGISTYEPMREEDMPLFKRFLKVFELSYTRYLDIEQAIAQAREAQIETALERVRSRAAAMYNSSELKDVANEMRNQLSLLGQKELETCAIHLYEVSADHFESWAALRSPKSEGEIVQVEALFPKKGIKIIEEAIANYSSAKKDYVLVSSGATALEFFEMMKERAPKAYNVLTQSLEGKQGNAVSAYWSVADFPGGSLVITTMVAPDESSRALLRRFANVFGLAYRRFADLKNAEAQAREAQIQLALERVRSRAMAMQNSDELNELIGTVFAELTKLDLVLTRCVIIIYVGNEKGVRWWMANSETPSRPMSFFVKYADMPFFNEYYKGWQGRVLKWQYILEGENKIKTDDFLFQETELSQLPGFVIAGMRAPGRVYLNASFNNFGNLTLASLEPLSDEHFDILLRFAKVFDLTYTRFNDLKQAEAQAREASIQLALERVRARTMAMQKPSEFVEVINIVGEQFINLGFDFDWVNFSANGHDVSKGIDIWNFVVVPGVYQGATRLFIPYLDHPVFTKAVESVSEYNASGNEFTVVLLNKKDKDSFLDHLFTNTIYKDLSDEAKTSQYKGEVYLTSNIVLKDTWLSVGKYDLKQLTDEQISILKRLAGAFGQAHTRFLDLQKAEAQAREAQIETALERVRSRTMGMQKSDELKDVIRVVLQQFVHLNIRVEHAGFYIDYRAHDDMHIWLADPNIEPFFVVLPYFDTPTWNSFLDAKANRKVIHTDLLDFEEKNNFYNSLFKLFTIPEEAKKFYLQCKGLAVSTVLLDTVGLYIENFDGIPYSDEENKILIRFGKVFEQTYTRFLDLQKAEEQAREAQIEVALERVRARTMAMHKSSELHATAELLFDQLKQLGAELQGVAFAICDKDSGMVQKWSSIGAFSHHYSIDPGEQRMYEAWKNQTGIYEEVYEGEKQKKYFESFMQIPEFRQGLQKFIDAGYPIPPWQKNHAVPFKHGYLLFITLKPFDETHIFIRFGKVFEQTYTRFLDLQKAEAQAREAQVEAALEKVRSRTLAMQKSCELAETAAVLFKQLISLGIEPNRLYINIIKNENGDAEFWITDEDGSKVSMAYEDNLDNNPTFKKMFDGWKEKKSTLIIDVHDEELKEYFRYLTSINVPFKGGLEQKRRVQHIAYFSKGFIGTASPDEQPAENLQLLERFAYVFNLTFARFNDLQVAEENIRKAIIEEQKLKEEKKRSDALLLNILPEEIANELKQFGRSYARRHEEVTVLFADIKGFSSIAEILSAQELVAQLDECFRAFDHIVEKHGLEKIKTVGDAYVCACGLPKPVNDHAAKAVRAAIDMRNFIQGFAITRTIQDLPAFDFRIGVNTGPVITGVVGLKKFTYDIWGDAVNMAARMEQHGEAGKVNISGTTHALVKDQFKCLYRGKVAAKNKGEVDMYFVEQ